jgi:hypothetical protein
MEPDISLANKTGQLDKLTTGDRACWGLIISMTQQRPMSLEQIQDFLDASQEFRFEGRGREEMYEWMKKT